MSPTVYIASDHAGVELKKHIQAQFKNYNWVDLGPQTTESVDYPDFADKLCKSVLSKKDSLGLLICGTGIGMSIRANRYPLIRAALCTQAEMAQLTRQHNNANVLCLGARITPEADNLQIVETFLLTPFEGGRHERRVSLLENSIDL